MSEDISKYFVGGYLATRYLSKVVETLAEFFSYEITRDVLLESIDASGDVVQGRVECLFMAEIGDEHFVLFYLWNCFNEFRE